MPISSLHSEQRLAKKGFWQRHSGQMAIMQSPYLFYGMLGTLKRRNIIANISGYY
jgi:hypothetical protein